MGWPLMIHLRFCGSTTINAFRRRPWALQLIDEGENAFTEVPPLCIMMCGWRQLKCVIFILTLLIILHLWG